MNTRNTGNVYKIMQGERGTCCGQRQKGSHKPENRYVRMAELQINFSFFKIPFNFILGFLTDKGNIKKIF